MLAKQILRTGMISAAILVVAVALDYLVNVVLAPGVTAYTPLSTIGITLLVAPAFTFYLVRQHDRVRQALIALSEERIAREAAERANEAKARFLAVMSHELRTPLNAVIGYTEMMRETAREAERASDVADHDRVIKAAHHLLHLINQVLDYARIDADEMQVEVGAVDVAALAREALDSVRPTALTNRDRLRLKLDDNLGEVRSDATKLRQCLMNLMANAVKFTQNGVVTLHVRRRGDRLAFDIVDTGIGIASEKIEELFQPFTQADVTATRLHGGAGLGLAITRRLARLLGGEVSAVSAPGKGSRFRLIVSAALDAAPGDRRALSRAA